jgi:hypothetical protein
MDEEEPEIEENIISRSERLRRRQAIQNQEQSKNYQRKYKPSPEKKLPRDGRGQWRRMRKMRESEAERERNSWRLFDKEDVANHENYNRLMNRDPDWMVTQDDMEAIEHDQNDDDLQEEDEYISSNEESYLDPATRHQKMIKESIAPKIYQRKFEHPPPLKDVSSQDDYSSNQEEIVSDSDSYSRVSLEEESCSEEENGNDSRYPLRCKYSRGRCTTSNLTKRRKESLNKVGFTMRTRNSKHRQPIQKKKKMARKIRVRKSASQNNKSIKIPQYSFPAKKESKINVDEQPSTSTRLKMVSTKYQKMKSNQGIEGRKYPKRRPWKIIDFGFDDQGKKFIENFESNCYFNFNKQMTAKKVAGSTVNKSKSKKPQKQVVSRSVSASATKSAKKVKSNSKPSKTGPTKKLVRSDSVSKNKTAGIQAGRKIGNKKQQCESRKIKDNSRTPSPAKHGIGHLFDIHHSMLKPVSKKQKSLEADEYMAIRKIAEKEELNDAPRGRFKFAMKKGPAKKFEKRERSREVEKYVKGQPITHNMKSFGNLGWVPYEDEYI